MAHSQREGVAPAGFDVRPTYTVPNPAAGPDRTKDFGAPLGSPQNPDGVVVRDSRLTRDREGFDVANPQPPKA